ncbi:Uncharacterised protein g7825 [Pycnogonum litorale]
MMDIGLIATFISVLLITYGISRLFRKSKLPPGPVGLPFIGSLIAIKYYTPAKYFQYLSKKYGPIITVYFGMEPVIVLNEYNEIKEILKMKQTQGRPSRGITYDVSQGLGVAFSNGEIWMSTRRLVLQRFRDSGMEKMEHAIEMELQNVTDYLEKCSEIGAPVQMDEFLEKSTCNIVFYLCFGKIYKYDDPELVENVHRLAQNFSLLLTAQSLSHFRPWINFISNKIDNTILKNVEGVRGMARSIIREHRQENVDVNDENYDFIYHYFSAMKKEREVEGTNTIFTDDSLTATILDIFGGGSETSATFVRWAILYLTEYPEIAKKMQQEIDNVTGRSRLPCWSDKVNLPYTTACMQEVERVASVVHMSVIHTCVESFKWNDYVIPKSTNILYNIWAVHHDPKLWKDPDQFNPDRFIDDSGHVSRPEYLIPFGTGRRICPGEMLGRMETFLYLATFVSRFDFQAVPGQPTIHSEAVQGLARSPMKYSVMVRKRSIE